jgi:hypothetical protein
MSCQAVPDLPLALSDDRRGRRAQGTPATCDGETRQSIVSTVMLG